MARRLQLQTILEQILGSNNVYFQAPQNVVMKYPCIVYERDNRWTEFAGNLPYAHKKRYMVQVIDRNPDSEIPDKLAELPLSSFSRHYVNDGLHHDVYSIYF